MNPQAREQALADTSGASPVLLAEGRVLDPLDRYAEVLFGLFMVVTFTGTLSVATAGHNDVKTMLIAAIGCNTAWGFVDGVMFVLRNIVTRGREAAIEQAIRAAPRPEDAHRLVALGVDDPLGDMARGYSVDLPGGHDGRDNARVRDAHAGVEHGD